jgi:hypothetical protein
VAPARARPRRRPPCPAPCAAPPASDPIRHPAPPELRVLRQARGACVRSRPAPLNGAIAIARADRPRATGGPAATSCASPAAWAEPRHRNHVSDPGEHSTPPTTMSEIFRIDIFNSVPCPHDVLPMDPLHVLDPAQTAPFPVIAPTNGQMPVYRALPLAMTRPGPVFCPAVEQDKRGRPLRRIEGRTTTPGSGNAADETRMTIRFLLNGEPQAVDAPPTTTLLDWLREKRA